MYETPILLITFNRPNHVRRVLKEILKQEPQDLYVCQDGAREGNDYDRMKCQEVRDVINELTSSYAVANKHFTLHTFYQSINLGCGPGPVAGISWFFSHVEQGIILEDDCLPHSDFFRYCSELLERYKENEKIGFIGGCNYVPIKTKASYSFSGGHHQTWGWATWKRTWDLYDYDLEAVSTVDFKEILSYYCKSWKQCEYWWHIYELVKKDRLNQSSWDYQFYFSCWKRKLLAVTPHVNLVANIGDGCDASHTNNKDNPLLFRHTNGILPLMHPLKIELDKDIDYKLMQNYIIPYNYGLSGLKRLPYQINSLIKRKIGHKGPWIKSKI